MGVDPAKVTVEPHRARIIEDKQSGFDNLLKLKEMGPVISIDDFGTGYSHCPTSSTFPQRS